MFLFFFTASEKLLLAWKEMEQTVELRGRVSCDLLKIRFDNRRINIFPCSCIGWPRSPKEEPWFVEHVKMSGPAYDMNEQTTILLSSVCEPCRCSVQEFCIPVLLWQIG